MDNTVSMTVIQGTGNLARELASLLLLEAAVGDDVVQHLSSVDKLEEHVPVVVGAYDISHATNIRVVQQADNGGFAGGPDLLGMVGSFAVGSALVLVLGLSGHYLDGHLAAC